jgi:AraC-like DNA-binding protein
MERCSCGHLRIGIVGHEDPAFFRRLFKRPTRLTPGDYRKRLRIPDFARP